MSLRDYFAAKAMQSIINNYKTRSDSEKFIEDREFFYDIIAEESYKLADAMLEARGKWLKNATAGMQFMTA